MTQGRLGFNNLSTQTLVFDFYDNAQGFRTFNMFPQLSAYFVMLKIKINYRLFKKKTPIHLRHIMNYYGMVC